MPVQSLVVPHDHHRLSKHRGGRNGAQVAGQHRWPLQREEVLVAAVPRCIPKATDGFEIARRDLEIRGPGEFLGARQSGQAMLRFADLETDGWLVDQARDVAHALLHDPAAQAVVEAHLERWLGGREEFLKV